MPAEAVRPADPDALKRYYRDLDGIGIPKPDTRKREKGRKDRVEKLTKTQVRAIVADRDGYCRAEGVQWACFGRSEWAHLEGTRRCLTRGMAPTTRHTTAGSMMLCVVHHGLYDAHNLKLEFLSTRGADGPVQWFLPGGESLKRER